MTQNYKWYRLLSEEELHCSSWSSILRSHGFSYDMGSYSDFAPDLIENCNYKAANKKEVYKYYVEWWNEHFGTKLHKHLYGVDDVL
jgi:hypothetical protein